jgi:hypothetical protein
MVTRMLDICEHEDGLTLHVDHRAEAAHELARLLLFLSERILDAKAKVKPLGEYDPDAEVALLDTPEEQAKIHNTARNMADGVWKPLVAKWRQRRPLVEVPGRAERRPKVRKPVKLSFRENMHYVPQSTTQQWADKKSGKFLVYTMGLDGKVRVKPGTAKLWGVAPFIYTQGLEHLLGLIEGDARGPYQKLVDVIPLNEMEERRWVAFLIAQYIRTPRFMRTSVKWQREWIERTGFPYSTSPAHLGRAFETLFTNNDLYASSHRLITGRAWEVVQAAKGLTFLKGDNPAVITGSAGDGTWRMLYPLTPTRCFVAGPVRESEPSRIVPHQRQLSDAETVALNVATCSFAEASVIGGSYADRIDPRPIIEAHLAKGRADAFAELPLWGLDVPRASSSRNKAET